MELFIWIYLLNTKVDTEENFNIYNYIYFIMKDVYWEKHIGIHSEGLSFKPLFRWGKDRHLKQNS